MVRRAVTLAGGLTGVVNSGDTVLIKPNIVGVQPSGCGEVTDVRVVKAVVKMVDEIDHGRIKIRVGDGSPRPSTTFEKNSGTAKGPWTQLFDRPGYQDLKTEMLGAGVDFELVNLNGNSDTDPWPELVYTDVPGGGQAQPQGGKYYVHGDVLSANVYIPIPVMKIHEPGMTVVLKDQIGIASSARYGMPKNTGVTQEGRVHKLSHWAQEPFAWTDKEIVDLSSIAMKNRRRFVVVDAIGCLDSIKDAHLVGNVVTNFVRMNTILAGEDPVAVDHVCARLMCLNPDDIEHITLAERVGLGTNNPRDIDIVGATLESTRRRFRKSPRASGLYGQGNRYWTLNGPYQIGSTSDPLNYEFISNEASLVPVAGQGGWSQGMYFINDRINLGDYFALGSSDKVVSYAFAYFTGPADQPAELWVGSDEGLKIYLNGNLVYNFNSTRVFGNGSYYSEIVPVNIRAGVNTILVKSVQKVTASYYDFSVNICDVETNPYYRGNRVWGVRFSTDGTVEGVPKLPTAQPAAFSLQDCYPNPFNGSVTIRYSVREGEEAGISIFNILGQKIRTVLPPQVHRTGSAAVTWDGADERGKTASTGTYFVVMKGQGGRSVVKKILFLK